MVEEIIQEPSLENVEVDTFLRQPIVRAKMTGVRRLNPRVASRCEAGERFSAKVASWCESSLRFTWKPAWRLQEAVFEVSDRGKKVLHSRRWTQCGSPCGWERGEVCSLRKIGSLRATFGLCCRSGEASCAASTGNGDGFSIGDVLDEEPVCVEAWRLAELEVVQRELAEEAAAEETARVNVEELAVRC